MPRVAIGLCALVLFFITPSVKADPVQITLGQVFVGISGGTTNFVLEGENFSVTSTGAAAGANPSCSPCTSGTPISISNMIGTNLGMGSATINGTTFNNIFFVGSFNFSVQDIVLPALPDGLIGVQIEPPVTFTGTIRGCLDAACTTEVFSVTELAGAGFAKAAFTFIGNQNGVSLFTPASLRYDLREIPEPMTMTLLASGMAGLGFKLRGRRKIR
jgi:hypothetical protein